MKLYELGVALGLKKTIRQYKLHQAKGNVASRHVTQVKKLRSVVCLCSLEKESRQRLIRGDRETDSLEEKPLRILPL